MAPDILAYLALAFLLGTLSTGLILRGRNRRIAVELSAERERSAALEAENKRIPELDNELKRLNDAVIRPLESDRARLSAQSERIPELEAKIRGHESTLNASQITNTSLRAENERMKAELDAERSNFRKLKEARDEFANQFEAISKRVLDTSNQSFLTLAKENFGQLHQTAKGDLENRQQAIDELLKPMRDSLSKLDDGNRAMERLRADAYATLAEQVNQLRQTDELARKEINKLISTLDAPKPRGDWGEEQLRRIVELAGLTEHCSFDVQVSLKGDAAFRADMIVHLAGDKSIIVDAKAPWDRELFQSEDSKEQQLKIKALCSNFRKHIDELNRRDYSSLVQDSPDFIVMFVPIEPVFHLALQTEPDLISYAIARKVVLASPTTLIAMLKSVAYGWQQDAISQNAQKISSLAKELYERFGVFGKHFATLGKNLNDSVKSYNDLLNSTESRLLVSARRFKDLKVNSATDIPESRSVDTLASFPSAIELRQEELLPAAGPDGTLH